MMLYLDELSVSVSFSVSRNAQHKDVYWVYEVSWKMLVDINIYLITFT